MNNFDENRPRRKRKFINFNKLLIYAMFVIYLSVQIFSAYRDTIPTDGSLTLTEVNKLIDDGKVDNIVVVKNDNLMTVYTTDGSVFDAVNPQNDTFIFDLMEKGVEIKVQKSTFFDEMVSLVLILPASLIFMLIALYLTNTVVGGNVKMFTILKPSKNSVTFKDIKGISETKKEVEFLVKQLGMWKELGELGARPCKGALFYGPPGTGKTMLARAIAKEAGVAFISASGSDFNEVFVGVGAARVRSLWDLACMNAPCIIFIDEIDCLGKRRKGGDGASQDHNQTLNALLQKMDGLNKNPGVLVIGATNRKEDLDDALLRPGRFDRHFYIGAPSNKNDRDEIVDVYLKTKKLHETVTLEKASKLLVGLTGAEIEAVLNEAVYVSIQDCRNGVIKYSDIDTAVMKHMVGGVEKPHTDKRDEEIAAIHEAGHALMNLFNNNDVSKVSIVAYSTGTGGVTVKDTDKEGDRKFKLIGDLYKDIEVLLAGMIAETIYYGDHSFGCSNDLERATSIIYNIATKYGKESDRLINVNTLIESGVKISVEKYIEDICNNQLKIIYDKVYKTLSDNKDLLFKLKDILIVEKTIVEPTLDNIKEYRFKEDKPMLNE